MKLVYLLLLITINASDLLPEFYHKWDTVNLKTIGCGDVVDVLDNPSIQVVTLNPDAEYKAFILFGEHARELIGPETGLHFFQQICNSKYDISKYQIKMILNMNPISRMKVEEGDYCLRLNENGVDLNRNYDAHFKQYEDKELQTNSGKEPFSEPETQVVRDILKDYKPDLYLSIHSGSVGLYTPYAYSIDEPENYDDLMKVVNQIQDDYCPPCEVGVSGKRVGYLAYGSGMDFAYDTMGIKHAFVYEIYHDTVNIRGDVEHGKKLRKQQDFLQIKEVETPEECFTYFNPTKEDDYNWYVQNWSDAIYKTVELSYNQKGGQQQDQQQNQDQQQDQQSNQSEDQQEDENKQDQSNVVLSHN